MRAAIAPVGIACLMVTAVACVPPASRLEKGLARAERARAAGHLSRAEAELRELLSFAPRDIGVRTRLADVLAAQNRLREALEVMTAAPPDTELDRPARALLGRILLGNGLVTQAARVLGALEREGALEAGLRDELLRAAARSEQAAEVAAAGPAEWRPGIVRLCLGLGRLEAALASLQVIASDDPARPELEDLGLQHALDSGTAPLLQSYPELYQACDTPRQLLVQLHLLVAGNQWERALTLERDFVSRYGHHPQRYDILLGMTRRLVRLGRWAEALERADEAIRLNPLRAEPVALKARALQGLGRHEEARLAFELVLDIDPHHRAALKALADTQERPRGQASVNLHLTASSPLEGR